MQLREINVIGVTSLFLPGSTRLTLINTDNNRIFLNIRDNPLPPRPKICLEVGLARSLFVF